MKPTASNQHWLDWFKNPPCFSHTTTPPLQDAYHSTRAAYNFDIPAANTPMATLNDQTIKQWSSITPRRPGTTTSDRSKRRTYPPSAQRVLKKEHLRFIDAGSTKHRSRQQRRRRHDLSGVLFSIVHSASASSFFSSSRSRGQSFLSSFHRSRSSINVVRSSMVLQYTEDSPIHPPGSVYRGDTDNNYWFSDLACLHDKSLTRQATVSDLSTLSDTDQKLSAPTTLSFYFSATWRSHTGKSGTKVIKVDETGQQQQQLEKKGSWWDTCDHDRSVTILAGLFLAGFLICPSWWLGATLYLSRAHAFNADLHDVHLWTPRTFGHLNCWMSATSLLLVAGMVAMFVWYHLPL